MSQLISQNNQSNGTDHVEIVAYSDDVNSKDYVAQFLNITDLNHEKPPLPQELINNFNQFYKEVYDFEDMPSEILDEEIDDNPSRKSCFHNVQKHLITTLKRAIIPEFIDENPKTNNLQRNLWEFFLKNPKKTRTLLYLVLGAIDLEAKKSKRIQRQYGLAKLIKNYSIGQITEAQNNLRNQILRQATTIDLEYELKNRRMKDKQTFRKYFIAFIEELKGGRINKRVPKDKKMIELGNENSKDFQGLSYNKA